MYSEDGELEEFPIVVERIEKCNKALVEGAVMVTADKKTSRETDVGRDDVREVRVSSGRDQAPAASNVAEVSVLPVALCSRSRLCLSSQRSTSFC